MRANHRRLTGWVLVFGLGFTAAWMMLPRSGDAAEPPPKTIKSKVVSLKNTPEHQAAWGQMRPYFTGQTPGTDRVFTAAGTILPGKAVHGAHRHVEEEYLLITEGSGTWHLDGKNFPASQGDLLYVEPWIYHGIRNTSDKPLRFMVVKYNPKGAKPRQRPDDRPDELEE